jgi:hypothetical protein
MAEQRLLQSGFELAGAREAAERHWQIGPFIFEVHLNA